MSKLIKKFDIFKRKCMNAGIAESRNRALLYFDALMVRLFLRMSIDEYFRNKYYENKFPVVAILREYYSLIDTNRNELSVFFDFLLCRIILGIRVEEYFRNEFCDLKWKCRQTFVAQRKKEKMLKLCNSSKFVPQIDDKEKFNKNFAEFLKRDWINLETCEKKDLLQFANTHQHCFCKLSDGLQGIGARKVDFSKESAEIFFEQNKGKKIILEELIEQHHDMATLNASTVNTIRVLTFVCADNTIKIVGASLRTGRMDQVADNFHMHGITASIDVESGIVMSDGVDARFYRYTLHPDSKVAIPGFVIPHWDIVLSEVKRAAMVYPTVRYVGWDIAIRENDICLVEGNSTSCADVLEMPLRRGIWKKLDPLVRDIKIQQKKVNAV